MHLIRDKLKENYTKNSKKILKRMSNKNLSYKPRIILKTTLSDSQALQPTYISNVALIPLQRKCTVIAL